MHAAKTASSPSARRVARAADGSAEGGGVDLRTTVHPFILRGETLGRAVVAP